MTDGWIASLKHWEQMSIYRLVGDAFFPGIFFLLYFGKLTLFCSVLMLDEQSVQFSSRPWQTDKVITGAELRQHEPTHGM